MKGFTIIETIVTIFVFTLIMGAVAGFIITLYKSQGYTWEQSVAISEARRGVETMVKEIREASAGEEGSYLIELAGDKDFIFYSDIDKDGKVEKVRYFLGQAVQGNLVQECQTATGGGQCSVNFSDFFTGTLKSAQVKISIDGDLDSSTEYVAVSADGNNLDNFCQIGCLHCAGAWQGTLIFDVMNQAADNFIRFTADATNRVGRECPTADPNHAMKARFELSWTEEVIGAGNELKKGVIQPTGSPVTYPVDQEEVSLLTSYIRNDPPIFEYFDAAGNKIMDYPVRVKDTKLMMVRLIINVNPNRPPSDFELKSAVKLRNLESE